MRNWRTQALSKSKNLIYNAHTSLFLNFFLARYDRDASRYHKSVYARKRADLTAALDSTLSPLFIGQLKNLHKYCLTQFKKALLNGLKGEEYDFGNVMIEARTKWETKFEEVAKEALVDDDDDDDSTTDWVWEDELESLREEIRSVADQCRKDETKKMVNQIEVCLTNGFSKGCSVC